MSRGRTSRAPARRDLIGPNAILQYLPVLERRAGADGLAAVFRLAGVAAPAGDVMIPETDAARFHFAVRTFAPAEAEAMAAEAGRRTAGYILEHRIPRAAQRLLRALPAPISARLLARAIARNAWTFVGSGRFRVVGPWHLEIRDNPLIRDERADTPRCTWNAAVFGELYRVLVDPGCRCEEVACAATGRSDVCRFHISR